MNSGDYVEIVGGSSYVGAYIGSFARVIHHLERPFIVRQCHFMVNVPSIEVKILQVSDGCREGKGVVRFSTEVLRKLSPEETIIASVLLL